MDTVLASDGSRLALNNLPQAFAYDVNANVVTITVIFSGVTYVQTFTYDVNQNVTNISRWIAQ